MSDASGYLPLDATRHGVPLPHWWSVTGDWVEPPNIRRRGWSGVVRARSGNITCYVKRQHNHLCHSLTHPFGWPTACREGHFLRVVRKLGVHVPEVLFLGHRVSGNEHEAILVTRALDGYEPLSAQTRLEQENALMLAQAVGQALGALHHARLQHGCLYDKHIMVRWTGTQPDVALLDLEKMRRRLTRSAAARRDLTQLQRHQQVFDDAAWRVLTQAHHHAMHGPR